MESIMETIESLLAALTSKKLRLYESLTEAVGQESGAHIDRHLDDGYISIGLEICRMSNAPDLSGCHPHKSPP